MAHEQTFPEDSRIAVPGQPLEAGIPSSAPVYFPANLSDVWSASPRATVRSDLGEQSSNATIAGNSPNMDSEEGVDGSSSGQKVKVLCSYQGKILPRPSDGMLRYVGGQTRIITITKNLRFFELEQKMIQVYGHPLVIKYQLPHEDLDALVSISCDEDIDNMMDEYDKLLERSSDGSPKLRLFLFQPSQVDSFEISQFGNAPESGQRYVEAVNGVVGGLENNESTASLFAQEPFQGSTVSVSPHQFSPAAHMSMAPFNAPIPAAPVLIKQVMQTHENGLANYPAESSVGIQKLVPLPTEPGYFTYQGTLAPCIPSGGYGWTQVPPSNYVVLSDGVVRQQVIMPETFPRVEDCHMSGALPHEHFDPIILGSDSSTMSVPYASSAYLTFRPDDVVRIQQTNKFMGQQSFLNQERDNLHNTNVVTANVETTEPFLNQIVKEVPIKLQVCRQQENPVDPSVAHGQYRQVSGLVENVKIHVPEIYTNFQKFVSPVDKTGEEDIKGSSSQQIAGKNTVPNDISGESSASHNIDHSGPTETLTRVVLPGHESQLKALCTPTQSPFLGNPSLHLQSLVGGQQFDSLEAQSSNSAYGAANLPSSLTSNPDAANLPSSLSSSVGAADLKESSKSLFSNQNPWNLQQDAYPPKPQETEAKKDRFYSHDHFGENESLLRRVPHLQDGIHHLETDSNIDGKTDQLSSSKGSEEEHIKQELQNVAEGVAASVLHSSISSYPEPPTKVDDYASNWKGEVSRNDEMKQQFTTHFKDIRNRLLERLNLDYSGSDSLDHLQIIMDSDLEELRELGSGTFGTVYHGKWRGTDVAIKRINDRCFARKPSEQERMIDDFWNEAENLAGLHHPNVVAFYGVVLDSPGGSVATVTEYMVNGSLRNVLQKNVRNLDRRKRLLIAMDIAFGMEYLHGKNIVHFDLKSDNLLVNLRDPHRPICKVGDLGLSKVKCQTLISGGVRGTLPWMAPELLNGISSLVYEKVDVFSFGIVLWELLTGEEPYADLHYGAIIGGIVSNTLRPPIPDLCDMDWKLLMERCWSAEPSERPSFTEIVDELRSMATKISL